MKDFIKKIIPNRIWSLVRWWFFRSKMNLLNDYSQTGETKIIKELLNKKKGETGFFIEIGANDGITLSNTYGLLKKGWGGISVEANPYVFQKLQSNLSRYKNVRTVCAVVTQERGPVKLYLGKNDPEGLFSTICTDDSTWFEEHRSKTFLNAVGTTLTELFDEYKISSSPDLLIIDAEGMDYEILLSFSFSKYRPILIVTEDYPPKNELKFNLLESVGYRLSRQVGYNTFWLKSN